MRTLYEWQEISLHAFWWRVRALYYIDCAVEYIMVSYECKYAMLYIEMLWQYGQIKIKIKWVTLRG